MKRKQVKRSSIFLLELMIAIMFFCLSSGVCIRLFVKSHTVSQDTQNLNMALSQVSAVAEVFRSGMDMQEFLEREYLEYEGNEEDLEFFIYYDKDWQECRKEEAEFYLSIQISEDGQESTGSFSMKNMDKKEEIYGVSLEKYTGGQRDEK